MKRKLIILAALVAVVALIVSAVHVSRSVAFFRDAAMLEALPEPQGELLFTAYEEMETLYVRLSVFRGEVQDVAGRMVESLHVLWQLEPRGNTRLHRYAFQLGFDGGFVSWSTAQNAHHMYISYGETVVRTPMWAAIVAGTQAFPAREWRGIFPTRNTVDALLIWGEIHQLAFFDELRITTIRPWLDLQLRGASSLFMHDFAHTFPIIEGEQP